MGEWFRLVNHNPPAGNFTLIVGQLENDFWFVSDTHIKGREDRLLFLPSPAPFQLSKSVGLRFLAPPWIVYKDDWEVEMLVWDGDVESVTPPFRSRLLEPGKNQLQESGMNWSYSGLASQSKALDVPDVTTLAGGAINATGNKYKAVFPALARGGGFAFQNRTNAVVHILIGPNPNAGTPGNSDYGVNPTYVVAPGGDFSFVDGDVTQEISVLTLNPAATGNLYGSRQKYVA